MKTKPGQVRRSNAAEQFKREFPGTSKPSGSAPLVKGTQQAKARMAEVRAARKQ